MSQTINPAAWIPGLIDAFRTGHNGDECGEWDEFAALAYQPGDGVSENCWGELEVDLTEACNPWRVFYEADAQGNASMRYFRSEVEARVFFEELRADAIKWGQDTSFDNFQGYKDFGRRFDPRESYLMP
jgi:hypothetical protein